MTKIVQDNGKKFFNYLNNYDIEKNIQKYNINTKDNIISAIQDDLFKLEQEFQSLLENNYLSIENIILKEVEIFELKFIFKRKVKIIQNQNNYQKLQKGFGYKFFRRFIKVFLSDDSFYQ